ncbi:MAG TPA: GAF domain-containing protein, partial [Thermoanaerobaculia bacterium]
MNDRLLSLGKRVLAERDVGRVLQLALDGAIEICAAERGMILLFDEAGEPLFEEARNLDGADIERPEFEVSRTILDRVRRLGEPFWSQNVLGEPQVGARGSVQRLKILSVLCLPMRQGGEIFGLVYLDNRRAAGAFT